MTRYASSTEVSAGRSREEIERTISRYGATAFGYGWENGRATREHLQYGRQALSMNYHAITAAHTMGPGVIIRTTPERYVEGRAAPNLGDTLNFEYHGPATVMALDGDAVDIEMRDGRRWHLTPLRPSEMRMTAAFEAGKGWRDWVVRGKAL